MLIKYFKEFSKCSFVKEIMAYSQGHGCKLQHFCLVSPRQNW